MAIAGLTDRAEPTLERFARLVCDVVHVPLALVSIVESDRQILPGAAGLPPGTDRLRSVPLSHSFCRYVVKDGAALVVDDTRRDPRLHDNPAIDQLGVAAYAGFPLTDTDGQVVGALCAIDHRPRRWTRTELRTLEDLAALCSREVVLHQLTHRSESVDATALGLSRRSRVLLELSEVLSDTLTMGDVGTAVVRAAAGGLGCAHAGIWYHADSQDRSLQFVADPLSVWERAETHPRIDLDAPNPLADCYASGRSLFFDDHTELERAYPEYASPRRAGDTDATVVVPLAVGGEALGCLALTWDRPRRFTEDDRSTVAALAVYTAQAVQRASLLDERMDAATTMQQALLTELPDPPGLELAARYRTAAVHDQVGGDWYDATVMADGGTTVMIGDVAGHDIRAAAVMGQLRSMLRALAWALDDAPSVNVSRLDQAARDLRLSTLASLVYARIDPPEAQGGIRRMRWTNAGHLPPVLVRHDGTSTVLADGATPDCIIGVLPECGRRDQQALLETGDTVLFFTDGLIERRDEDLDTGVSRLRETVAHHHGSSVDELLDAVLAEVVGDERADDVAVLAVRLV